MAKPRMQAYPEPAPGSVAAILGDLLRRDGRSMRAVSLAAGLAGDACRNVCRHASAQPRPKTLEALARALGVDVRTLLGQIPIPDVVNRPIEEKPAAFLMKARKTAHDNPRVALRSAVRVAMAQAVADGLPIRWTLSDAVIAAMLWAAHAGMDDNEAAEIIGAIGIPDYC